MMRMRGTICATTILLSILGHRAALGDDIVYRFTGQTEEAAIQAGQTRPANADISIDVGEVNGDFELWIYDYTRVPNPDGGTLPDQSIGRVTIIGTWTSGAVRLLVGGPDSVWPFNRLDPLPLADPGVVNLGFLDANNVVHGGFDFRDASGNANPDLQKHTRLAAFTSNDIYGDITVGQIQRVRAGRLPHEAAEAGPASSAGYLSLASMPIPLRLGPGGLFSMAIGGFLASSFIR